MSQETPQVVALHEMKAGQKGDFFALLAERSKGATRDGKPYYQCRFRDKQRTAAFMVWADSQWYQTCEQDWREGEFYKIRAIFQDHRQYGPQLDIQQIRPVNEDDAVDGFAVGDFINASQFNPDDMFQELWTLADENITDEPLRNLVLTIFHNYEASLKQCPATQKRFHNFPGGLLEHTLSVAKSCLWLAEKYSIYYSDLQPPLNRDLIVAGALLHDIGRVLEFKGDLLVTEHTIPGRLLGHLFLGRDLVRETAKELGNVNPELLMLLEHMIIAHLNHPEWGSPRLPLIPEVIILHHADDLDAKMQLYARCLRDDQEDGEFTARDPFLGRQILKARNV